MATEGVRTLDIEISYAILFAFPMLLGIEIGGTKLQLVLGSKTCQILRRLKLNVDSARGAEGIREQIRRELPALTRAQEIQAVGVGFGGPVDWGSGKICKSHQIE